MRACFFFPVLGNHEEGRFLPEVGYAGCARVAHGGFKAGKEFMQGQCCFSFVGNPSFHSFRQSFCRRTVAVDCVSLRPSRRAAHASVLLVVAAANSEQSSRSLFAPSEQIAYHHSGGSCSQRNRDIARSPDPAVCNYWNSCAILAHCISDLACREEGRRSRSGYSGGRAD